MSDWPLPRLIAHRGGGAAAPENTRAGLRTAAAAGFRAVEFDVMLSADGVPLLIHDETLQRTTDGRGRVCDRPAARLRELDAGVRFGAGFAGERIPLLDEALALCRDLGLAANVEIKPARGHEADTGRIVARCAAAHAADVPMVLSSFSLEALDAARQAAPALPRGVLFRRLPRGWLDTARRAEALSVHCEWSRLGEAAIAAAQAAHIPLVVYTCNEPHEGRRLLDAGVAGVITDRLDLMAPLLEL